MVDDAAFSFSNEAPAMWLHLLLSVLSMASPEIRLRKLQNSQKCHRPELQCFLTNLHLKKELKILFQLLIMITYNPQVHPMNEYRSTLNDDTWSPSCAS